MKKIITLSILSLLTCGVTISAAGQTADEYPVIAPHMEIHGGFSLLNPSDTPRSSWAADYSPATLERAGTNRAIEYGGDDSSLLLGGTIEAFPFPHRFYLDLDIEGDDDWFGEIQHSYKDIFQFRAVSHRFQHNLDNITLFNVGPQLTPAVTPGAVTERQDAGMNYGMTIDMDKFKMRLKTPNFPFRIYTEGELIRRDGFRQQRFRGRALSGATTVDSRVSQAREVDQQTREITIGANAHLRWIEADLSHSRQDFESDAATPSYYFLDDINAISSRNEGTFNHNVLPELEASKNTLKLHTTQTGQIFASLTLVDLERSNNTTGVEAERKMGHGDVMWTPRGNLSLGAKFRHQENSSSGPTSMNTPYFMLDGVTPLGAVEVKQGVESSTNTVTGFVRYAPLSSLTLKGQYSFEQMEREQSSVLDWGLAENKDTGTLELGASWRARRDLKVNAKYIHMNIDVDPGIAGVSYNSDPEETNQFSADATYFPTAKTSLLLSGMLKRETAVDLQAGVYLDAFNAFFPVTVNGRNVNDYKAFWQRYLASLTHTFSERFAVTGSYAYSLMDTERDLGVGTTVIDGGYDNQQAYHNFAVNTSFQATEQLSFDALIDYTICSGDYSVTKSMLLAPAAGTPLSIADISGVDTRELEVRLDSEYDMGQGLRAGVTLRYVDWAEKSFDNPAEGEMVGGLVKLTKVFH